MLFNQVCIITSPESGESTEIYRRHTILFPLCITIRMVLLVDEVRQLQRLEMDVTLEGVFKHSVLGYHPWMFMKYVKCMDAKNVPGRQSHPTEAKENVIKIKSQLIKNRIFY